MVLFVYRDEYYLAKKEPERESHESEEKFNLRYDLYRERLEKATTRPRSSSANSVTVRPG